MGDALIADLKQAIAKYDAIVVVGTGVVAAATAQNKLASWPGLIEHGIDRCVDLPLMNGTVERVLLKDGDVDHLLMGAESVSRKLGAPEGGEYGQWLHESVGGLRVVRRDVED